MSSRRLEIVSRRALVASVAGYAMDGFDMLILVFLLAPMSAELGLSQLQASSLVTGTLVGAVVGGIVFGILSDRLGRVKVLSWTILLFAWFTGMCALAQGYWDLLIYRSIAGLGLGGEFGIGMTLVGETWPASHRARASSYVAVGWQLGVLLAALLTPMLLPLVGWRGVWAVGLLPALVSAVLRRMIDEPELFRENRTQGNNNANSIRGLFGRDNRNASIGMLVLCSVQNFGYYGIMVWLPGYLSAQFGYSLTRSSLWTAVTVMGMCLGIFAFGEIADRLGRRPAFYMFQVGAAGSVLLYSNLTSSFALLAGGAVMGFFVNGMVGGYGTLLSELYPTEVRATAQNTLFNTGRAVGGLGPMVVGALSASYSFATTATLLACLYVLDLVVIAVLIPETKGKRLE